MIQCVCLSGAGKHLSLKAHTEWRNGGGVPVALAADGV